MRLLTSTLILFLFSTSMPEQNTEEEAIKAVALAAYNGLSFDEGGEPDYDMLRSAFLDGAIFRSYRADTAQVFTIEKYMVDYRGAVESGAFKAIREKEVWAQTQVFGKVAHRFSTYVLYINDMNTIVERGINSMQLVKTEEGWKINSITYDTEKQRQTIPAIYLPKGK